MHKLPASPAVISSSGYPRVFLMILTAISSNFKGLLAASESLRVAAAAVGKAITTVAAAYDAVSKAL